ncbi:unnamed protein product [Mytilus edulis]|uniref:Uncharacterized protein n=1 Tax=Mytilus edulis TaxID=6550 RepID=A0A8S3REZ1_MYTED|nr:unnamed protein product [Mytilus edulis]
MTWLEASTSCGEQGLEDNEDKIKNSGIQIKIEFWIGRAVYSEITPWIELLGCTSSTDTGLKVYKVETIGQCQHKCDAEQVFGYAYKHRLMKMTSNGDKTSTTAYFIVCKRTSFCYHHHSAHTTDSSYIPGVRAWTHVFRDNFVVEKSGLHQNPTMCYKGILHNIENRTKQLDDYLGDCSDGVKWFICKNSE